MLPKYAQRHVCGILQLWVTWIILTLGYEAELRLRTNPDSGEKKQHKAGR